MNFFDAEGKPEDGSEEVIVALNLVRGLALPMVLKSVLELNIFDIMVAAGDDAWLSASDMASQLPTNNPDAAAMLDRMLGLLACYSIVNSKVETKEDGEIDGQERKQQCRLYGVTPISKLLTNNEEQSVGPLFMLLHEKSRIQSWCQLTNSVLQGGTPFVRAHGMTSYKYQQEHQELNQLFNKAMYNQTAIIMRKIVDTYKGFERLGTLVDVGGGSGAALSIIISKYPNIKGINFDLPQAVKNASTYSGMEHVSGDMFERVPSGDAIFLKSILHNWNDEHCIKLLKNCNHGLPDNGFVIIVEGILPTVPDTHIMSIFAHYQDLGMLAHTGGKERTLQEYEALGHKSGFYCCKVMCNAYGFYVMELQKKAD